jgi:hypothetical protein
MSDPKPASSPPWSKVFPDSWHRCRVYAWSTLLSLALWGAATIVIMRIDPIRVVHGLAAQSPFPTSVGDAFWLDDKTLQVIDVRVGDFFYADTITIHASLTDLWRRHITSIEVTGPQLYTGAMDRALAKLPSSDNAGIDWTISHLIIHRGTLVFDVGPHLAPIPVRIGVFRPVVLDHLHLAHPGSDPVMMRERMVELENINILSPFDPLAAPVLSFPLIRIRFTYPEIWRHHIRAVELIHPVIHLGQDLFWFTDEMKQGRGSASAAATGVSAPWDIGTFSAAYGQLAINAFGQQGVTFPFIFDTHVKDIRLDQIDKITAKSAIAIRDFSRNYPDYKINVEHLTGKIEFSIPPSDAQANNVVPTIQIGELSWNGIAAKDVSASVTFDPTGIFGKLTGKCESGLIDGNLEVYYTKGFQWNADFFAHQIDCRPVTDNLAGKYFQLSGTLDGKIAVQGKATDVQSCTGALTLAHPGLLEVSSLDDLTQRLPADTPALKRQAIALAIGTLRHYPYNHGQLKIDYHGGLGTATLHLDSPVGKRDFDVYWHPFGEVAKDSDSR